MIIVDTFEPPEIGYILKQKIETTTADLQPLGFLDYLWYGCDNHSITVERKEVHDFVNSLDRLELQLKKALGRADEVILLTEGIFEPIESSTITYREKKDGGVFFRDRVKNMPYAYFMGFLWRIDKLGVSYFSTASMKGTAVALLEFYKASQDSEYTTFKRYIKRKPTIMQPNPAVTKLMGLGMGEMRAIALIKKFKTVWAVLHADIDDLLQVEGVGKKTIEELMKGIGKEWPPC